MTTPQSEAARLEKYATALHQISGMAQRTDFMDRFYCKTALIAIEKLASDVIACHKFNVEPETVVLSAPPTSEARAALADEVDEWRKQLPPAWYNQPLLKRISEALRTLRTLPAAQPTIRWTCRECGHTHDDQGEGPEGRCPKCGITDWSHAILSAARSRHDALSSQQAEEWVVLAPKEPTEEMIDAAYQLGPNLTQEPQPVRIYRAMIAAAPSAPTGERAAGLTADARDAARWRALIGCGHLRMMGWAGFDKDGAPNKEHLHFGMEAWSHPYADLDEAHEKMCREMKARAITVLTNFADRLSPKTDAEKEE